MNFKEAFDLMKQGAKVKLPGWNGYWCWDDDKKTIMIHCRIKDSDAGQGDVLDIRETQRVEYTFMHTQRDDWMIADEENCGVLGGQSTFGFGVAKLYRTINALLQLTSVVTESMRSTHITGINRSCMKMCTERLRTPVIQKNK